MVSVRHTRQTLDSRRYIRGTYGVHVASPVVLLDRPRAGPAAVARRRKHLAQHAEAGLQPPPRRGVERRQHLGQVRLGGAADALERGAPGGVTSIITTRRSFVGRRRAAPSRAAPSR